MPRTRSIAWSEVKLGIVGVVAVALVILMILALSGEGGFTWQRYPLKTRFRDAAGLKEGAVVRLSGKEVGTVTAVEFSGAELDVAIEVRKEVRNLITSDSVASIGSLSLLGESMVEIRAATTGTPLADWQYVKSGTGSGLSDLQGQVSTSLENVDRLITDLRAGRGTMGKLLTDDAVYNELQQFVESAAAVTQELNQGRGTLGALVKDPAAYQSLKTSLENLQTMTARINKGEGSLGRLLNDESVAKSLSSTTANLDQITARLKGGEGTAGRLLTDRELYDRLNSTAGRVDQIVANLNAGQGTAGQLLRDRELYENMNRAVGELRALLADIRKDPKKFLRVSVSIF
ncbi:MAG TPA: MlaD family protein [Vicinamibacterales bacterium]|nr:MlaD family protein [Vicinamibacterales bacterium]